MDIAMLILTVISTLVSVISLLYTILIKKEVANISENNNYSHQSIKGNNNKQAGRDYNEY